MLRPLPPCSAGVRHIALNPCLESQGFVLDSRLYIFFFFADSRADMSVASRGAPRTLPLISTACHGNPRLLSWVVATEMSTVIPMAASAAMSSAVPVAVPAAVRGNVHGNVRNHVHGHVRSNARGNVSGDVSGNVSGNVLGY